jgi:hypothetical protein
MSGNPLNLPPVVAAPGYYAVEDPAIPGRLTAWSVDGRGGIHRYPSLQRWEPEHPEFRDIVDHTERRAARAAWYENTYRVWKVAVIDRIGAEPTAAAAAFLEAYPDAPMHKHSARRIELAERIRRAKLADDILTAALIASGSSVAAAALRVSRARSTVRDRVAGAYAAVAEDPVKARLALRENPQPSARESLPDADSTPVDLEAFVAEFLARRDIPEGGIPDAEETC